MRNRLAVAAGVCDARGKLGSVSNWQTPSACFERPVAQTSLWGGIVPACLAIVDVATTGRGTQRRAPEPPVIVEKEMLELWTAFRSGTHSFVRIGMAWRHVILTSARSHNRRRGAGGRHPQREQHLQANGSRASRPELGCGALRPLGTEGGTWPRCAGGCHPPTAGRADPPPADKAGLGCELCATGEPYSAASDAPERVVA